ncbi:hypothetical protein [Pseudomonas oryzihabitans]|uniref:Uncharacterized protein n=1 Tax=Pseudomonas oryzihabitans TaxID=47885 RepID=A0ABX3ITP7_9PSED|nr:hypothetical protein [Pseudomonas psychrotolerans]ONN71025.1 hypothetical protein BVL52_10940 [Pseudomonas psychrotolerans]
MYLSVAITREELHSNVNNIFESILSKNLKYALVTIQYTLGELLMHCNIVSSETGLDAIIQELGAVAQRSYVGIRDQFLHYD